MSETSKKQLEVSKETTAIIKKYTPEEARNWIKDCLKADCDPDVIFRNAAEQIYVYRSDNKKEAEKANKELLENSDKHLMALGLETHYAIAETTDSRFRPLVIEVARQIEKEYGCKTPSEKILVETIAGAYGRIIEYSKKLECCTRLNYLSTEANGYYTMLSKELDRAHRQLLTALTTLKQIKNPPFELNVKAKTAFVSQNQQINVENPPKSTNLETNESK